jgi:leucine dehydrogenase
MENRRQLMDVFSVMRDNEVENLFFCQDGPTGLKAVIAIHSTALGPALGGTRFWEYASEEEAVRDVIRLARGMSYKSAVAGLDLGGGKGVILGDPGKLRSRELFKAYGGYIERLGGMYITAEDAGTTPRDMDWIAEETRWVLGTSNSGGDPSPYTARGVYQGIKAALEFVYGTPELRRRRIAVQGVGNVGSHLCRMLSREGARLVLCDLDEKACSMACQETGAEQASPQGIHAAECDVFAPCALGGVINEHTVDELGCRIVAGGANNVLASKRQGDLLQQMGIVYVPDYVINAGGVICVADQLHGFDPDRVAARVDAIGDTCRRVLEMAQRENIPTYRAADAIAEERMRRNAVES